MLGNSAAFAQAPGAKTVPLPPIPPPSLTAPSEPAVPPYEAQLDRFAEIIGTLAYMRDLCGDGDGPAWHDKMVALLDAEAQTSVRKARLAGSYNRGYRGYQLTYRSCTAAARVVIDRSLDEGARIAHDLSLRFGGD